MKNVRMLFCVLLAGGISTSANLFAQDSGKVKTKVLPEVAAAAATTGTNGSSAQTGLKAGKRVKPLPEIPAERQPSKKYEHPTRRGEKAQP